MAVEDILRRIAADAEQEARSILERARAEADTISHEAHERIECEREKLASAAEQKASEERNRIVTLARLEARRRVLTEKQRLIDLVFQETRKRIVSMKSDEYQRLIAKFLSDVAGSGEYEIIIDPEEKRIDQSFLDRASKESPNLTLKLADERRRIGGGFVVRSGRTETNCALDTILREARERMEIEVAARLFDLEK